MLKTRVPLLFSLFITVCFASGYGYPSVAWGYNYYHGDIHSHTGFSDGVDGSTPADAYAHSRDVGMDFYCVTDHVFPEEPSDFYLSMQVDEYEQMKADANLANQDGLYVALYGYEWTVHDGPHGNVFMAPDFIWSVKPWNFYQNIFSQRLADQNVFGKFDHPAIDEQHTWNNWDFSSKGAWSMRLVEVRSDFPPAIYRGDLTGEIAEYVVALEEGWLLGVDGSKDTHSDTWGEFGENPWQKYNTVALANDLTREDILDALQMRRTYVSQDTDYQTNPLGVELQASTDGGSTYPYIMGEAVNAAGLSQVTLRLIAQEGGTDYLDEVRIYKNGTAVATETGIHNTYYSLVYTDSGPSHGDFYFAVVIEEDGEVALTSPIFIRNGDTDADGLTDEGEINLIGTNPNYNDTDGDGHTDGEEVEYGKDPLDQYVYPNFCYVSATTGSDGSGDGTKDEPWATIQHAIDTVTGTEVNPAEIRVAAGTYAENVLMDNYESLYGGYDPADWSRDIQANETIVDGSGGGENPRTITGASSSTVDGFTITGGGSYVYPYPVGGGVYCPNVDTEISNCVFVGNGIGVKSSPVMWPSTPAEPTMRDCTFRENDCGISSFIEYAPDALMVISGCTFTNNGCALDAGYGFESFDISDSSFKNNTYGSICLNGGGNADIADCEITDNGGRISGWNGTFTRCIVKNNGGGIRFGPWEEGGSGQLIIDSCIIIGNAGGVSSWSILEGWGALGVYNSIIAYNGERGVSFSSSIYEDWSYLSVRNSTIVGHTSYGIISSSSHWGVARNCIVWDNGDDLYSVSSTYSDIQDGDPGTGNILVDPLFFDPANGDYRLASGSPCIDTGTDTGITEDFEGDTRPLDGDFSGTSEFDMGADEYNPAIVPPPTSTPTITPVPTPTPTPTTALYESLPTATPTATPVPDLELDVSATNVRSGDQFTVEVVFNTAIDQPVDGYVVIISPNGSLFSLESVDKLVGGLVPLFSSITAVPAGYTVSSPDLLIGNIAPGEYTLICGVVPAGTPPSLETAIYYSSVKVVVN